MKRTIFTLIIMLGLSFLLSAQIEIKPTFGINLSRLSTEPESFTQSARVGYQLGGSLQFGKKLYVEPGIFWLKSGSELAHTDEPNLNYTMDVSAIRIPVFVGYQILGGDKENTFGLRVFGGPTGSWVTKVQTGDNKLEKDDFSSFLWGLDVGAGIDVWLLFLDVGHEWGLNQLLKEDIAEAKVHAWWFNLGVRIRIK